MLRSSFGRGGWCLERTSDGHVRKHKYITSARLNLIMSRRVKLLGNLTGTDSKVLVPGFCEWIKRYLESDYYHY